MTDRHSDNQDRCRIEVPFSYPLWFTRNIFDVDNQTLTDVISEQSTRFPVRCLVVVDSGVVDCNPDVLSRVEQYVDAHANVLQLPAPSLVLPGGEAAKNSFDAVLKVIRLARQIHLCRQSYVIAVGGGAVLDAVGFAASLIHRGVRLIRIPTTVLAQNDSGIGVKNGVNLRGAKNFLGTFAPPAAVLNDAEFLTTLLDRDWIAGIAEAYKVAIIKDAEFLDWLQATAADLVQRDLDSMSILIRRCAGLHLTHIMTGGDPFEFGSARPLDFGHWAAHKLESLTLNELRHGEAVAIGMAIDLLYASKLGFISRDDAVTTIQSLSMSGLPVWSDALCVNGESGQPLVLHGIEEFRQHLGGQLHVTLPCPLGQSTEVTRLDRTLVCQCIEDLADLALHLSRSASK